MLSAYVMELTMPDMELYRERQTFMMAMNMGAGLLLGPLGGSLALLGLGMPFAVSAWGAAAGLVFSLCVMRDVSELKPKPEEEAEAARLEDQAREEAQEEAPALSPWLDGAILLQSCGYFFFGMGMGLAALLLPSFLGLPLFHLPDGQAIAAVVGFAAFPGAVTTLLMMSFGYLQLSKRGLSDRSAILCGGAIISLSQLLYPLTTALWQLFAISALGGTGTGLFLSAFINMPNEYVAKFFSSSLAQAKGVPYPFFNVGFILGPFLLPLLERAFAAPALMPAAFATLACIYAAATVSCWHCGRRMQRATCSSPLAPHRELRQVLRRAELKVLAAVRFQLAGTQVVYHPPGVARAGSFPPSPLAPGSAGLVQT